MKILHTVESYLPSRHGMQEVVTQLSEKLVSMGHEVTVATSWDKNRKTSSINGVNIVSFKVAGNMAIGMTGETNLYQDFLRTGSFDIITNFAAQQWATDLMLPLLNEIGGKKVFVPTGFSALKVPAYSDYFENMKNWMRGYDMNVFLAENYRDIDFAKANGIKSVTLIPNGANEAEFETTPFVDIRKLIGVSPDTRIVLNVGNHTGFKGHKEAMEIFKAANIKNSVLLLVGSAIKNGQPLIRFAKEVINLAGLKKSSCNIQCKLTAARFNSLKKNRGIVVKAFNRLTTINAFKQADVFLFTSLLECSPIVLFETLVASTPFLCGDVGNAKEIIEWTNGGKLLPTQIDKYGFSRVQIEKSAEMLENIISNKQELDLLGKVGRQAVLDHFTWSNIAKRYEDLYIQLIKRK